MGLYTLKDRNNKRGDNMRVFRSKNSKKPWHILVIDRSIDIEEEELLHMSLCESLCILPFNPSDVEIEIRDYEEGMKLCSSCIGKAYKKGKISIEVNDDILIEEELSLKCTESYMYVMVEIDKSYWNKQELFTLLNNRFDNIYFEVKESRRNRIIVLRDIHNDYDRYKEEVLEVINEKELINFEFYQTKEDTADIVISIDQGFYWNETLIVYLNKEFYRHNVYFKLNYIRNMGSHPIIKFVKNKYNLNYIHSEFENFKVKFQKFLDNHFNGWRMVQ